LLPPKSPPAFQLETAHRPLPSSLLPFAPTPPEHFGRHCNRARSSATRPLAEVPATSPPHSPPWSHSARTPNPPRALQQTLLAPFAPGPAALRNASIEILSAPLPSASETLSAPPAPPSDTP